MGDRLMRGVNWRVVAASVAGASHLKLGQPCQDSHYWLHLPEGILLAAVADGAGSAMLGDIGAGVAARTAVETLRRSVGDEGLANCHDEARWNHSLLEALRAAREAVEIEAAARSMAARELATTLLLLVAAPELAAAAQIGDGAVVLGDGQGKPLAHTAPKLGEYINETTFLVSPGALDEAQVAIWRGTPAHVAVFSDGLQMVALKLPGCTPHAPFFDPLFRFVQHATDEDKARGKLIDFLVSRRIRERTDDDLTMLLGALVDNDHGDPCCDANRTDKS